MQQKEEIIEERIVNKIEDINVKGKQVVVTEVSLVHLGRIYKGEHSGCVKSGFENRFPSLTEVDAVEESPWVDDSTKDKGS
ncbi:hypothetical protein PTKIN_Ptkin03bG0128200 [Pterospermum kingtungense]